MQHIPLSFPHRHRCQLPLSRDDDIRDVIVRPTVLTDSMKRPTTPHQLSESHQSKKALECSYHPSHRPPIPKILAIDAGRLWTTVALWDEKVVCLLELLFISSRVACKIVL